MHSQYCYCSSVRCPTCLLMFIQLLALARISTPTKNQVVSTKIFGYFMLFPVLSLLDECPLKEMVPWQWSLSARTCLMLAWHSPSTMCLGCNYYCLSYFMGLPCNYCLSYFTPLILSSVVMLLSERMATKSKKLIERLEAMTFESMQNPKDPSTPMSSSSW